MVGYLLAGISLGLSAGFSPGPLFALVISQTMKHGLREGIKSSFSPLLTDVPIIFLSTFLLSTVYAHQAWLGVISIAGGAFLAYLAYENIKITGVSHLTDGEAANSISKGATVNALNPHPYLFWITVGSPMIINAYMQGVAYAACFILSFYVCLVGAKIILAVIVNHSRDFFNGKAYVYVMKALGLALAVFAYFLFKEGLRLLINS
jgi:threonine/homoserine/homoserine lactone efflux protein